MVEDTSLIWNPILRQYLVNAPHRMNRREGSTSCAFCDDITEGRVGPAEQVRLHPNDFPPFLEREFGTVLQSDKEGLGCPFCSVRAELTKSEYEVVANSTWQAFLPPYVRYPYETHLYPRRHVANLAHVKDKELNDLAELLLQVVQGYNALYDGAMAPVPYLLGIHQLADSRFHLHVEILAIGRAPGKLKYAASSESLWGLWTNDSSPIQKASELRDAIAKIKYE